MTSSRRSSREENPPRLLLVEGNDDVQVIRELARLDQSSPSFAVWQRAGIDGLLGVIPSHYLAQDRIALGIIVDADDNARFRWNDVASKLELVGVELPSRPQFGGTVVEAQRCRVGVWVMPNNRDDGQLEDFIRNMIPPLDPIWPRAEAYIDGIPDTERKFRLTKILRAKVSAWLATRERPRPMWIAIQQGDLQLEENSRTFLDWLRRLFGDNP